MQQHEQTSHDILSWRSQMKKKSQMEMNTHCDSIYLKVKTKQKPSMVTGVSKWPLLGREMGKRHQKTFWGYGNALYLDFGGGPMVCANVKFLLYCTFKICAF